jgi:outer membrane protein assembly factor BamA
LIEIFTAPRKTLKFQIVKGVLFLFLLELQACITTPFFKKGEYLLIGQRAKGQKNITTEDLELLYQQKANRKVLGLTPYLGFYFFGKSIWDTSRIRKQIQQKEAYYNQKIEALSRGAIRDSLALESKKEKRTKRLYLNLYEGNWWMRVVGEPPSIYDSSKSRETIVEIKNHLFNKGFFDNEVSLREDTFIGGNVALRYLIKENSPHRIRKINILTDDYRIEQILDSSKAQLSLRAGQNYNKGHLIQDRETIEKILRNKGYFTFSREYVVASVDTGFKPIMSREDSVLAQKQPWHFSRMGCDITLKIRNPEEGRHKPFVINRINFTLNESDSTKISVGDSLISDSIHYYLQTKRKYSLGILNSKILVKPGQFFHYSKLTNTQAQLSGMDMFRYVNLSIDTFGTKMRLAITANRLPKYQMSNELGMLMSQGAPGPYINLGFKIRNIFGGFEVFEINGRYSQEGQLSTFIPSDVVFRARDLTITSSFTISKILFPFSLGNRIFEFNPKTRFIFSLTALKRPEYTRNLIKGALSYTLNISPTRQIGISPSDITVNIAPLTNDFYKEQLIAFSGLGRRGVEQSFTTSLVTNFNAFYMYNENIGGQKKKARYFRLNVEYGGELMHQIIRNILRRDTNAIGPFKLFRYARITADFRIYRPTSKNSMVAFRLAGGFSTPLQPSDVLPWEKYNFAGGSNSIRAWLPRRLGPGSYSPAGSDPNNLRVEQPGEIILESSIELRQKIIGFLEGALFADAGNVWNFEKDKDRPGAEINPLFLQQIALGAGFGFRFDFSFLIIRIDAATKIYNPAFADDAQKWTVRNISLKRPFGTSGQTLLNVGIGYPF